MRKLLFLHTDTVSRETLTAWLSELPDWRREAALRFRFHSKQAECAKSYLMLCELLKEEYGIDGKPSFVIGEHGKPSLREHPEIHFSMSHCRKGILCVVDTQPVGCDIEKFPEKLKESLIDYCMNADEKEAIMSAQNPNAEFARLWTMKEALGKLSGKGIGKNLPNMLSKETTEQTEIETCVDENEGFAYSICHYL